MTIDTVLDPLDVAEDDVITFDFSSKAAAGETSITSIVELSCGVYDGIDPAPANLLYGASQTTGMQVLQGIVGALAFANTPGGLQDVQYHIRCVAKMNSGHNRTLACLLPVVRL